MTIINPFNSLIFYLDRTYFNCTLFQQVIVLNTNLYNVPNNLTWGEDDPCGQLTWFEQELQLAQSKNIRVREPKKCAINSKSNLKLVFVQVIVAAHIPPGYFERWIGPPFFNSGQNDRYVQLIHRYGDVILTHVYGHTHTDSFRIFADNSSKQFFSIH